MSRHSSISNGVFAEVSEGDLAYVNPAFEQWRQIEVEFGNPVILEKYAERLHHFIMGHASINWVYTVDDLTKYFRTIVGLRIAYVNQEHKAVSIYPRWYVIPSTINVLLNLIGRVTDERLGVELVPTNNSEQVLDPEVFTQMSNSLRALSTTSIQFTLEGPRSREGDWHFMMLQNTSGVIQSMEQTPCHVSYALAASFLEAKQLADVFNPMLSYGSASAYEHVLDRLVV